MSHQIKINLPNENSSSKILQPIIISWTNPSTDDQSQLINDTHIKQEDELQIISHVIQEATSSTITRKSAEIISPTRILRSHGKIDKSSVIEVKKVVLKARKGRKLQSIAKIDDLTLDTQVKNTKIQDIELNSNKKSTNSINIEDLKDNSITVPKRKRTSKLRATTTKIQDTSSTTQDKVTKKPTKKDKNDNSLEMTIATEETSLDRNGDSSPLQKEQNFSNQEDSISKIAKITIKSLQSLQNSNQSSSNHQFSQSSSSSSDNVNITISNIKPNYLNIQSDFNNKESINNDDDITDDDDDDVRLVIKEDDEIETIDISDSDEETQTAAVPKNLQNSWNNINFNPDSNSISSHVSISYPSIDGSTSLQPPVIQISYQFPMDSQASASSTQIQKHFMLSGLEASSGQLKKNLSQNSNFGELFGGNVQQDQVKLDASKQLSRNLSIQPSTSQLEVPKTNEKQKPVKKRSHSLLISSSAANDLPSTSKSVEHPPKKQKLTQESNQIPIIPYIPTTITSRRISSTSSDGSSSSHPFQCKMCLATFRRKIDMIHHLKSHSEAKYECQRCGMKFKFEGYFQKHECIVCEICNKTFFLKQQLRNHQRNEHDIHTEMFECDLCDKKLRFRHALLYHMSKTHMKFLEDKYACDVCGKRFKLKESTRLHIKNHEAVIDCQLCDKKVKKINMHVHMKLVHTTERNFKCRICKACFKTKECLKSHVRTHEKSFKCTECGKRFSNKSHLNEHMEWHKNPEVYKCTICQKTYSQKYCLKAHIKLHESGHLFPKFKCSLCPYSTDKTENLEKHELRHKRQEETQEIKKNWVQCEKCNLKLKNKLKLATHYWKKHSEVMPK